MSQWRRLVLFRQKKEEKKIFFFSLFILLFLCNCVIGRNCTCVLVAMVYIIGYNPLSTVFPNKLFSSLTHKNKITRPPFFFLLTKLFNKWWFIQDHELNIFRLRSWLFLFSQSVINRKWPTIEFAKSFFLPITSAHVLPVAMCIPQALSCTKICIFLDNK